MLCQEALAPEEVVASCCCFNSVSAFCPGGLTHGMDEGGGTAVLQPGGGGFGGIGGDGGDKPPGDEDPNWHKSLLASIPCA